MTRHTLNIHDLRNGSHARDRAILDLLHLQQLGMAPGSAPVPLLRQLWSCSQSQVSRRMAAVADLGTYRIETNWGRYLLIELSKHRRARQLDQRTWTERREAVRRQMEEAIA